MGALLDGKDVVRNTGRLFGYGNDAAALEENYTDWTWKNAAGKVLGYALNSTNPLSILEDAADIREAIAGSLEANRQELQARRQSIELSLRRTSQIRGEREKIQQSLARIDAELAEINRLKGLATAQAQQYREQIRKQKAKAQNGQDAGRQQGVDGQDGEEFEQPELPKGPGYPTLTKEQRDAISERARLRKEGKEPIRGEGDALEGIFAELDELESERIRQEELERQAEELALAIEKNRKKEKEAWQAMKDRNKDLTEIFGDFIENNMFDFGGMTGKGLSGTVATDLSPYAEWLLDQDIKRLDAMARAAGYPNLASALNDWRNLTKKANDQGFRQWAYSMAAFSGTIDSSFSEQQHALARAQLALGDLLNDTRFIESTAGLTDLAISGTTLSTIFRDFGIEDGDNIQIEVIQFGRILFTQTLTLRTGGTPIEAQLRPGVGLVNILALNEGFASPNTAEITVQNVVAGDSVQQYSLRTGENATLRVQVGR